ncbi:hypothetical protein [Larkinella arboricola]|uniref:Uncharacterized protein n=1 Tax=Larkinella arboricola TaxID=643671 RepID=A0A327X190_LARAB|nr:hypothetical protein [Larkinella arboricola]RAK00098.1 hypothetical protein LX87_01796 [Larkinella arboricola]
MKALVAGLLLVVSLSAAAQTKPAATTPPAVVSAIEGITAKHFQPDTVYAALSEEDQKVLANEPIANWGLAQESGGMTYYNLIVGTRSYQLLITKAPKEEFPKATLLRYADPKSKPEPIARGMLKPKEEKAK